MNNQPHSRIVKTIAALVCLVFSVGLISFALIGTASRYMQDDYCYANFLRGDSFFRSQYSSYLSQTVFSGNRFSLTLGMALSELAGPGSVPLLPGLMLFAWLIGLYSLLRRISNQTPLLSLNRVEAFIVSQAVILFTLSIAPNWVQSFFWRPGMFPYFAPIVTGTYLVLLISVAANAARWRPVWLFGVFFLALLTGGFSETAVSVEIVLLAVMLGLSLLINNLRRSIALPSAIALFGAALAMALLIASPTNAARLRYAYGSAASLQSTLVNALDGGIYFYLATAYRPTLLYASALIFFGLMGLIHAALHQKPPLAWKHYWIGLLASVALAYGLTAAALAPSFYAQSSYPGERALIIPAFVSILLAASVGWLTGRLLARWWKTRWFATLAVLAGAGVVCINALWLSGMTEHFLPPAYPDMRSFVKLNFASLISLFVLSAAILASVFLKFKIQAIAFLVIIAYLIQPGLMAARILHEYPLLRQRAALWDQRHAQIITARESGERQVTVRALDSLVGLTDLSDNSGYWVNNCAADYYGLDWIRGVEPVLDPIPLVKP